MRYTKYISSLVQGQGTPQLSSRSFSSIMNIIHLEGAIASLEKIKSKNKNPATKHKYDVWLKDYVSKLESITDQLPPEQLLKAIAQLTD